MELHSNTYTLKDGQTLTLRSPLEDDAQALIDLMRTADSETKFLAREPGELSFTLEQEKAFIRARTNDSNCCFLVAELGGEIVGSCSVGYVSTQKRFLHRAVMGLLLKKDYWNRGIGTNMMRECISWCREKGIEQLELDVVTQNTRAIALYEKFGFEICGTKKRALKYADGTYADEYLMCLFLNGSEP